jgi:hypothetical protein
MVGTGKHHFKHVGWAQKAKKSHVLPHMRIIDLKQISSTVGDGSHEGENMHGRNREREGN